MRRKTKITTLKVKKTKKTKKIPRPISKTNEKKNKISGKIKKSPIKFQPPSVSPPKPKKVRKKNPSRMYFTQDTEDAIEKYNCETKAEHREEIFKTKIHYPLEKLVENVFNTFKFSYFETGPLDVQKECLTHLVSNMHKYKQVRGKAFSYFSIIAKHYFILLNNTNYKKFNQNVEISEDKDEHTVQLQHVDKHHAAQEMNDFIKILVKFWENNVNKIFSKQRDLDIANAVIELFRNSDRIDAYNKKALYLYIREMAMCKTQQITKVINKMKEYYDDIHKSYTDNGHIDKDTCAII